MPNHVHVVLQPFETCIHSQAANVDRLRSIEQEAFHSEEIADSASVLSRIMHSLKSYTANRANEFLNRSGSFWQSESYDHWVRDINELERIVDYIRFNPVRAELCDRPEQWRFSSAFDRYQKDGSMTGLVGWLRDDWRR
jgi:putative DNA methylase